MARGQGERVEQLETDDPIHDAVLLDHAVQLTHAVQLDPAVQLDYAVLLNARVLIAFTLLLAAGPVAGCGGGQPSEYAWVATSAPSTWPRTPRGPGIADMARPPGWRVLAGPHLEVSVARLSADGRVLALVEASSAPAETTPAAWLARRAARERARGARDVAVEARSRRLVFAAGSGACMTDSYATAATRYREIACLIATRPRPTAVVAAAPVANWAAEAGDLQRIVVSLRAPRATVSAPAGQPR